MTIMAQPLNNNLKAYQLNIAIAKNSLVAIQSPDHSMVCKLTDNTTT